MSGLCRDKKLHSSRLFYTDASESTLYLEKIPRFQKFRVAGYRVYRELAGGAVMVCESGESVKLEKDDIVSVELYDRRGLKNGYYRVNRHHFFVYTGSGLKEGVANDFLLKVIGTMTW
ncbi:MAG: hypothetical protein J6M02_03720 [Clostridia bacterium]|nr:hypothetical protein [Clostridia bacterium]